MPYVDGRKVAAAIKASSARTPVIMLTGWGQRLIAENDIPPHVDRVLSKPPRLHELRAALAESARAAMSAGTLCARILIVDDEAAQMKALCDTLGYEGYATTGFTSARRALEVLREQEFDLLLTDLMMPEIDGIQLLAAAREIAPDLVGIMMTGPRHHRYRREGDAGRRARLHRQAVQAERDPAGAESRAGRASAAARERASWSERRASARGSWNSPTVSSNPRTRSSRPSRIPCRTICARRCARCRASARSTWTTSRRASRQEACRCSSTCSQGSQRMGQLIEDLLEFSRLGRQPILRQIVPLDRMVARLVDEHARQGA